MTRQTSGKKKKKVETDVGTVGQQDDQFEFDDETITASVSDQSLDRVLLTRSMYIMVR